MNQLKKRILDISLQWFFDFGFASVSMDEISRELGISKKTLYQHFSSKKQLLREGLENRVEQIARGLDSILGREDLDYPRRLTQLMKFMSENLPRPSRRFFGDMTRVPDVWRPVHQRRGEVIRSRFGRLFREGVKGGFLREDLGPDFLLLVFTALIENVMNPKVLAEQPLSAAQAFERICSVLWLGVLTEKGRETLKQGASQEVLR